ncbi:hypothetical protein MMC07_009526 [Pseudocyphellaria aurata]|nr:hypothetical protein [Pseudocyphellaria aurata]
MVNMNVFRILGDLSHTASKCILIWAIHTNKSAEGISLITQTLYAAVFCTRYLDLFYTVVAKATLWNFVLKIFYISSSLYIIFLMMRVYARTREREKAWRLGAIGLGGAVTAAPFVTLFTHGWAGTTINETLWTFSIILESVCVLPQLILLRQTTVPTVIDSFYLLTLGSYRAFYILNWIVRAAQEHRVDVIAVIFGIIQTAFYVDFAWVYWTRQRVKLRNGGVVDSDDLSRGWLLRRLLGRHGGSLDEEDRVGNENPAAGPRESSRGKWGPRGISVSADDETGDGFDSRAGVKQDKDSKSNANDFRDLVDPDEVEDGDDDGVPPASGRTNGVTNGFMHGRA